MLSEQELNEVKAGTLAERVRTIPNTLGGFTHDVMQAVYEDRIMNALPCHEVARKHCLTEGQVNRIVKYKSDSTPLDSVSVIRKTEFLRIDIMISKLWPKAAEGNMNAIKTIADLMRLRAEYVPFLRVDPKQAGGEEMDRLAQILGMSREELDATIADMKGGSDFGGQETSSEG